MVQSPGGTLGMKTSLDRRQGTFHLLWKSQKTGEFYISGQWTNGDSGGWVVFLERLCIMLNVSKGTSLQNLILVY